MNFHNSNVPVQVDLLHKLDHVSISLTDRSLQSPVQPPTYIPFHFFADVQPSLVQVPCVLAPAFANISRG
jgi:hypothetical protein